MGDNIESDNGKMVLLVEGEGDRHFVWHIRNQIASHLEFEIIVKRHLSRLIESLYPEIVFAGHDAIGILVDADDDFGKRWHELAGRLSQTGVSVPRNPCENGTIIRVALGLPRIGIWIMPDNKSIGELEDFVIDMIPNGDLVWPMARDYIEGIPGCERKFSAGKIDRAKLYAWLATQEKPPHIGAAIGQGDLNVQTQLCDLFADWLHRLFGTEAQPNG